MTKKAKAAVKVQKTVIDYDNAPVEFTPEDRREMIRDAKVYFKSATGKAATMADVEQVIADNHGEAVAKAVCGGKAVRAEVAANGTPKVDVVTLQDAVNQTEAKMKAKKTAKAPKAAKAEKAVKAPKAAAPRKLALILGHSVVSVARAFGLAGYKPADAVAAIHAVEPKASVNAIRTFVQAGRHSLRGTPAPLTKKQLKELVAAAAA